MPALPRLPPPPPAAALHPPALCHCFGPTCLQNGVHYHFTTRDAFEEDIVQGKFLEYAYVHKNIYGTSIQAVQDVATSGRCCVLDIDVQGARQVGSLAA